MRFPLKRVWSVIRDNRYAKYVLLALAPAVAQPLDYEPPAKRIHARMRGLYLLPIIPAWWWGQINDSLVGWITWRQMQPGGSLEQVTLHHPISLCSRHIHSVLFSGALHS